MNAIVEEDVVREDGFEPMLERLDRRALLRRLAMLGLLPSFASVAGCFGGSDDGAAGGEVGDARSVAGSLSDEEIATLGWANVGTIESLDLARSFTNQSLTGMMLVVEPLMLFDKTFQPVPWLAAKAAEAGPRRLVYTLREGVTFSDGSPLTPEDVVFSWQRHTEKELASQLGYYLGSLDRAEQTGANEVTIALTKVDPLFKFNACFVHVYNRKQAEQLGDTLGSPKGIPIGTGPYTIESYKPSTGLTAIRNDAYWGEKPRARRVELKVIADTDTRRLATQEGSVAGSFDVPNDQLRRWKNTPEVRVAESGGLGSFFFAFNVTEAPWDDENVRKALSHCIDREGLVRAALGGGGEPANCLATRGHWANLLGTEGADAFLQTLPTYAFDLEQAKAALQKSSTPEGFRTEIKTSATDPTYKKMVLSVAQNAAKIGVTLDVKEISDDAYRDAIFNTRPPGMWAIGYQPVYPDPMDYLGITLSKDSIPAGGYNAARWSDPECERLLAEQAKTTGAARADAIKRIAEIAGEQQPYAPVMWAAVTLAVREEYALNEFDPYTLSRPWPLYVGKVA